MAAPCRQLLGSRGALASRYRFQVAWADAAPGSAAATASDSRVRNFDSDLLMAASGLLFDAWRRVGARVYWEAIFEPVARCSFESIAWVIVTQRLGRDCKEGRQIRVSPT
ncbi:hypothetical protein RA210_U30315 [Rubrivivax sp. A210]|nr:hypothetical protein RA210_U30315 [Rubrivivax sp. A210]